MLRYSFVHAPINWQWSREGRVLIWVVSVRVSVSCALKRKEDWCYYSNAKHTSKGLYLPILTNERSSARMIGQAIAVPFLLFLFITINRHLWFIDIGAPGSTPNHQPFMELPDQENKFPDIIKKVRRGLAPLKQKALNDFHDVAEMITVKHKIQSWNLQTLVSWDRASYLVDSPFPPPRALAFRVDTQEIYYVNWHDIIPEEYDVPGLASLDSPPTSRRGGSISISIPEIAFSSIFSETGEFLLYLQECYLGRRISWLRSTWIYSFCVPHLPMFKHPPIPQWKEMLLRDQRKLVPRQKDLVRRVEAIPQDIGLKLLRETFCLTTRHGNWSSALSFRLSWHSKSLIFRVGIP